MSEKSRNVNTLLFLEVRTLVELACGCVSHMQKWSLRFACVYVFLHSWQYFSFGLKLKNDMGCQNDSDVVTSHTMPKGTKQLSMYSQFA